MSSIDRLLKTTRTWLLWLVILTFTVLWGLGIFRFNPKPSMPVCPDRIDSIEYNGEKLMEKYLYGAVSAQNEYGKTYHYTFQTDEGTKRGPTKHDLVISMECGKQPPNPKEG